MSFKTSNDIFILVYAARRVHIIQHLRCKRFSNSIDPTTIPKTNKEIKRLLECLTKDSISYLDSIKDSDSFVSHFKESILPRVEKKKLPEKFVEEIDKFASAELIKTTFVTSSFAKILEKTSEDIEWWMEKYSKKAKLRRGEPETFELDDLIDTTKIAYEDFVHLSVLLSQMFFALEFSCKMLCGFGCYRFALKVSKSEIIQHKEIWRQLKKLGQKTGYDCEVCAVKESCDFEIDFLALARVYAYAMKVRQIADYTTRLASLNIFKSGLFEPPLEYFSCLTKIVENNFFLGKKCLPDKYLSRVPVRFLLFSEKRRELYAPFSWDEAELKRVTAKQPENALAWYLLGKLYFKRNDIFQAIEYLEKAGRINPKTPETWHLLGILCDVSAGTWRDERKALKHLEKARELNPDNVDILFEVSVMHMGLGNCSKAVEYLERAKKVATNSDNLCALNQALYEAYSRLGNLTKANDCLESAKKIDPRFQQRLKEWLEEFLKERKRFERHSKRARNKAG